MDGLLDQLRKLNRLSLLIQCEDLTGSGAPVYFDNVLKTILLWLSDWILMQRLSMIRISRQISWIYNTTKRALSLNTKKFAAQLLLQESRSKLAKSVRHDSIVGRTLKRIKCPNDMTSWCLRFKFVLFASRICERLFPVSGHALTDRGRIVLCANFEAQLFLYKDCHVWGVYEARDLVTDTTLREEK